MKTAFNALTMAVITAAVDPILRPPVAQPSVPMPAAVAPVISLRIASAFSFGHSSLRNLPGAPRFRTLAQGTEPSVPGTGRSVAC